jgi:cytochrome b subunit of formate dehydrogenase
MKGILKKMLMVSTMAGLLMVSFVGAALATTECQSCHRDEPFREDFSRSVHGANGCTSCHQGIVSLDRHMAGDEKPQLLACTKCHGDVAASYNKSYHAVYQNMTCQDCHRGIHALKKADTDPRKAGVRTCTGCHAADQYATLGHTGKFLKGNPDAATCNDCHGIHDLPAYDLASASDRAAKRIAATEKCRSCHGDPALAKRNHLSSAVIEHYGETYHGKVFDVGYPDLVAGCADCHAGHNILPPGDVRSSLSPDRLAQRCAQCHQGFHPRFARYIGHPDFSNPRQYPTLFWANVFMIGLLVGTFMFFWAHSLLWWRKVYSLKCRERQGYMKPRGIVPECDAGRQVQRFTLVERIMHVALILSFFTLVMTGFPLKYHQTAWAKIMVDLFGGAVLAGIFHRIAAAVLIGLFLYTAWLSLKFLFPGGKAEGWLGRLFGPDSLCPNLKDLRDIKGMFLWFFNRGEMPRFDRWTYWEKFDFLAVFWGMTVIGGSGLTLWFPELASYIFPGWVLNVAALVHSEEAFLAAIFIFTVHFFNNHLVPNKFPLEGNIFTGRYPVERLQEERELEYERLVREGRLEDLKRPAPGMLTQLLSSAFGLVSLLLGLFLTGLIFWAVLFY